MPGYWLMKTEPETYSFEQLTRDKRTNWNDVRNYQARNYLREMVEGDLFFYHSNTSPPGSPAWAASRARRILTRSSATPKASTTTPDRLGDPTRCPTRRSAPRSATQTSRRRSTLDARRDASRRRAAVPVSAARTPGDTCGRRLDFSL